jgi:hypothetical protein
MDDDELLNKIYGDEPKDEQPKRRVITFEILFKENLEDEESRHDDILPETKIPPSILWTDLEDKVFPEQAWRIKDLLPKQGHVILASIAGNRKTWLALSMIKSIVSDKNFLNCEEFKTEGANVLYINAENSESEIQRRGRQLGFEEIPEEHKLHVCNAEDLNLNKLWGAVWLKTFIQYHKIEVVFVDTFIATAGGLKEDKSEEVRQFFNRFNSLKNKGVVVVWLAHMRKPTNFEGKIPKKEMLLGSQDKTASVEVLLMLHSESGSDEISIYQRKNRLGIEIPPFKVSMRDHVEPGGRKITTLAFEGPIEEQENKREEAKNRILEILANGPQITNQIIEQIKKAVGVKNIRIALGELVKTGLVECTRQGKQNLYTLPKEPGLEEGGVPMTKDDLDFFGNP